MRRSTRVSGRATAATVGRRHISRKTLLQPCPREAVGSGTWPKSSFARAVRTRSSFPRGSPPPPGTTGLYHVAIRYPDRATLGDALRRLRDAGIPISGATDHGVSEAIYLRDPDSNGVELYRDRPQEEWPRAEDGSFTMFTKPLDVAGLLAELDA